MKDDMLIVIVGIIICLAFMIIGVSIGRDWIKRDAIAAGVAHYTVNSTNGTTTFEFKKP